MPKQDAIGKSYHFLVSCERSGKQFALNELCDATGWKPGTPRSYLSKKWSEWIVKEGEGYRVSGLIDLSENEYRRHMSQMSGSSKQTPFPERVERLVQKARQSAILALDIYNRPATQFRTEGYIMQMIVAWTATLHAIFERDGVDYIHTDKQGNPFLIDGKPKLWGITDCLRQHFGDGNPPVRRNIEFIIGLRNEIEHRYVPEIDVHVAGECQALLLNFERLIAGEFGLDYSISDALSMPLQTSSLRNEARTNAIRAMQANHYREVMDYIELYRSELPDSVYADPSYSFRVYLIPKISNHKSASDVAIEFVKFDPERPEEMEVLEKQIALIRDRRVPVVNAGMHKPKTVAKLVAEQLGRRFSIHNHTQAWKYYKVRGPGQDPDKCCTQYCQFDNVHGDYVYTAAWVEFLVQKLSNPDEYDRVTQSRPSVSKDDGTSR